ncbi:unnamed protein product, partial [Effrenium voratum]
RLAVRGSRANDACPRCAAMRRAVLAWLGGVAAQSLSDYEVVQQGNEDKGHIYIFPHLRGGHAALESQRTLNQFKELGILEDMKKCNRDSTDYINRELCRLRRDLNLSAVFVPSQLMQRLDDDGCFRSAWRERFVKHLEKTNVAWRDFSANCDAQIVGKQANALYGFQLPNPYGLFMIQNSEVRIC